MLSQEALLYSIVNTSRTYISIWSQRRRWTMGQHDLHARKRRHRRPMAAGVRMVSGSNQGRCCRYAHEAHRYHRTPVACARSLPSERAAPRCDAHGEPEPPPTSLSINTDLVAQEKRWMRSPRMLCASKEALEVKYLRCVLTRNEDSPYICCKLCCMGPSSIDERCWPLTAVDEGKA